MTRAITHCLLESPLTGSWNQGQSRDSDLPTCNREYNHSTWWRNSQTHQGSAKQRVMTTCHFPRLIRYAPQEKLKNNRLSWTLCSCSQVWSRLALRPGQRSHCRGRGRLGTYHITLWALPDLSRKPRRGGNCVSSKNYWYTGLPPKLPALCQITTTQVVSSHDLVFEEWPLQKCTFILLEVLIQVSPEESSEGCLSTNQTYCFSCQPHQNFINRLSYQMKVLFSAPS